MTASVATRTPRRALLVGINDYPNPDDRLEGCVNDVFKISATLQQIGFDPEDIRVLFNERDRCRNPRTICVVTRRSAGR
jgi:hypothetical protein